MLTAGTIVLLERCVAEAGREEVCGFLLEGRSGQHFYRLTNHADLPFQFRIVVHDGAWDVARCTTEWHRFIDG